MAEPPQILRASALIISFLWGEWLIGNEDFGEGECGSKDKKDKIDKRDKRDGRDKRDESEKREKGK